MCIQKYLANVNDCLNYVEISSYEELKALGLLGKDTRISSILAKATIGKRELEKVFKAHIEAQSILVSRAISMVDACNLVQHSKAVHHCAVDSTKDFIKDCYAPNLPTIEIPDSCAVCIKHRLKKEFNLMTDTYEFDDLEVEFSYAPYEPPEKRAANGDPPQYPGREESVTIEAVCLKGATFEDGSKCDVTHLLSKSFIEDLEQKVLDRIHSDK